MQLLNFPCHSLLLTCGRNCGATDIVSCYPQRAASIKFSRSTMTAELKIQSLCKMYKYIDDEMEMHETEYWIERNYFFVNGRNGEKWNVLKGKMTLFLIKFLNRYRVHVLWYNCALKSLMWIENQILAWRACSDSRENRVRFSES